MKNRDFEDETRSSALEIVVTLSESLATLLRKNPADLKEKFVPALAFMMTEVDMADDLDGWLAEEELDVQAKQDPANIAADGLQRFSVFVGEKTTLTCCSDLLKAAIGSSDWKENWMGYKFLGMISEACKKAFKSNLTEIAQMSASGLTSQNPRVRYEALQSVGTLLIDQSPNFQTKFHADLMPLLLKMMNEDSHLKMQTQSVAAMSAFFKGLQEADDDEQAEKNKNVLLPYADDLVVAIGTLFGKAIEQNYRPLQEEVLSALSCMASLLDTNFEAHYGKFMPGLVNILQTAKSETDQEQQLRASCFDCIGAILTSVKSKPEICKNDAIAISNMIVTQMQKDDMSPSDP